jgi:probable rRNA maturation factor
VRLFVTNSQPRACELTVVNRQRVRRVEKIVLTDLLEAFLARFATEWRVSVVLVTQNTMERLNMQFLGHEGSTDVITFDQGSKGRRLCGEIYISVADAVSQAGDFGVPWAEEVFRYAIHGMLHLAGYDDLSPGPRRRMKAAEGRWVAIFRSKTMKIAGRAKACRGQ